jgi:Zinc carboxypeptidase
MAANPPPRIAAGNYHFHAYDYPKSALKGPWELSNAQSERGNLQFYSMAQDLQGLANQGTLRQVPNSLLRNVGIRTEQGRRTKMLSLGNRGNVAGRPTVLITGGIHAREWIAPEIAYLIAEYLVINYDPGPRQNLNRYQRVIRDLVDTRNIRIIPMLNPDGIDHTVFGKVNIDDAPPRMWRKNLTQLPKTGAEWVSLLTPGGDPVLPFENVRLPWLGQPIAVYDVPDYDPDNDIPPEWPSYKNQQLATGKTGVDLNRNCTTLAWGYDCKDKSGERMNFDPGSDTYFGPGSGSERETGNVQMAMWLEGRATGRDVTIDYHSYGRFILYPTELPQGGPDPVHSALAACLRLLIKDQDGQRYMVGTPLELAGYHATGTIADRAGQAQQARALTIELDPADKDQNPEEAFQLPEDQIMGVFEANIRGALMAVAAPASVYAAYQALEELRIWNVYGRGNQLPQ